VDFNARAPQPFRSAESSFRRARAFINKAEQEDAMPEPLTVSIPHRLGKDEALRRIKGGFDRAKTEFAWAIRFDDERWEGDRFDFRVSAMAQHAAGSITVLDDSVRVEVTLPWLLARFAQAAQRVIGQSGAKMLEKK
jgi:hypothetical protein